MQRIRERLARLDPSLNHTIEKRGDAVLVTLIDPARRVTVECAFATRQLDDQKFVDQVLANARAELGNSVEDVTSVPQRH